MPSNDKGHWDPATVIGLKRTDEVLVIGNAAFMPWLTDVCGDVSSVRKPVDVAALVQEGEEFDKIILPREASFSPDLVPLLAALLKNSDLERGMIVIFPSDDGWSQLSDVGAYFPEARQWEAVSSFGLVQMFELPPTSWRMIHG